MEGHRLSKQLLEGSHLRPTPWQRSRDSGRSAIFPWWIPLRGWLQAECRTLFDEDGWEIREMEKAERKANGDSRSQAGRCRPTSHAPALSLEDFTDQISVAGILHGVVAGGDVAVQEKLGDGRQRSRGVRGQLLVRLLEKKRQLEDPGEAVDQAPDTEGRRLRVSSS